MRGCDARSGVAQSFYTVDGGATQTYTGAVTVSGQGVHTITYWSVDNAGNTETANTTHIKLDNVKPSTSIAVTPVSPNGSNGWYVTTPSFTLSASDATSGVATTLYKIDSGATQTYSGAVSIPDGQHTITYWSVDTAGNTESAATTSTIKVDTVKPSTSITISPASPDGTNGWRVSATSFTLGGSDATSGVASTFYKIDGGCNPDVHGERGLDPPGFPHRQLLVGRHRRQHGERDHDPSDQGRPGQAVDDADHLAGEPGRHEQLVPAVERHLHPGRDRRHLRSREPLLHHRRRRPADLLRHRHRLHPGRPHRHLLVGRQRRQHRDHQHHPHQARQRQAGNDADHLAGEPRRHEQLVQAVERHLFAQRDRTRPPASATTLYTVDGGAQQTYSGTVTVSTQGDHTVTYWSVDNAGNTETTNTTHIKLDNVKPATTLTTSPASPDGTNNWFKQSSVTFTLAATDATSGVANRFYTIDGGSQQTYSGTVTVSTQGDHTVTYWSVDNAGNTETTNTTHIKLDNVAPTNSLALTNKTGGSFVNGNTVYYRGAAAGSFSIQNTVADATSGAASSSFPALGGTTTGWTHTAPDVKTTPSGGPYVSNLFSWTAGTTSSPTEVGDRRRRRRQHRRRADADLHQRLDRARDHRQHGVDREHLQEHDPDRDAHTDRRCVRCRGDVLHDQRLDADHQLEPGHLDLALGGRQLHDQVLHRRQRRQHGDGQDGRLDDLHRQDRTGADERRRWPTPESRGRPPRATH